MADRRQCVKDILLETDGTPNKGWQTAPNIPAVYLETKDNPLSGHINKSTTDGEIIIRKGYSFRRNKLSETYETRVWEFDLVIISQSDTLLQAMFDQCREVFDRYTDSPFSTDTNSITYSRADIDEATQDPSIHHFAMDVKVYLTEQFADVVIA